MTKINTGGPAFPVNAECAIRPVTDASGEDIQSGMTLRDWFAGQTLVGLGVWSPGDTAADISAHARWAYEQADAMITARKQNAYPAANAEISAAELDAVIIAVSREVWDGRELTDAEILEVTDADFRSIIHTVLRAFLAHRGERT